MDYRAMSAAQLGRAMEAGKVDPVEITELFLDAIAREDGNFQIYARTTADRARSQAKAARERAKSGTRRSPLDGVPVSWKDLFDIAGTQCCSGTRILAGRVPDADCRVAVNAETAGLVFLGKTHQTEFAFSGLGLNPQTATPPNKGMPGTVPGGSSSGAAASLTHRLAPLAIGSDTGGSVRIPAAWNNLAGLKTTHGSLSNDGVVPLCPGFDTVGPLAHSVEDAALAFAALGGGETVFDDLPMVASMKIAIPQTIVLDDCASEVSASFEAAVDMLEKAGAKIDRIEVPEFHEFLKLSVSLFPHEAWQAWGNTIESHGELMFAPVRARFEQGRNVSRETYEAAWRQMLLARSRFAERVAGHDFLIWPSVAILPPRVDDLLADSGYFTASNLMALRNTRFVNMSGGAALTMPLATTACGLQLSGQPGSDRELLRFGMALERVISA
ncbi:MAG: amidase family protein [Nitratireductor sp.]